MKKVVKSIPPDNMQENDILQGYELYPESEDIYKKFREEKSIDPEDISEDKKTDSGNSAASTDEEWNADVFGRDLDVPGSELDDEEENIGNEDEENNYYSIGGDDHNNLDEDEDET